GGEVLRAEMAIDEGDGLAVRDAETPGEFSISERRDAILAAGAGVNRFLVSSVWRGRGGPDVLARAGAGIDATTGLEQGEGFAVEDHAFALGVRREGSAEVRALLPGETEPAQNLEHRG